MPSADPCGITSPSFPIPFSYFQLLEPWRQHFALAPLILFYTPETLSRASIVDDIAGLIGLELSKLDEDARSRRLNRGRLSWYVVEACREMNARDIQTELVVRFAQIMHAVEATAADYDIMLPSECGQLIASGARSLEALKTQRVISEIPAHFRQLPDPAADAQWHSDRANRNAAWSRVLDDIATLTDI